MIETTVDDQHDLTIHSCSGSLTEEEFMDAIQSFYKENPTRYVIWDFAKASLADILSDFVRQSSEMVKRLGVARRNGKSAVIASSDLEYGLARMFQIMTDNGEIPFKIKVFRYFREATRWLFEKE